MSNHSTMTREETIAAIRARMSQLVDQEHPACQVASELAIGCRGMSQYTDDELRHRYAWLLRGHEGATRRELEDRIYRWSLARQEVHNVPLACDAESIDCDVCHGWKGRTDADLENLYKELFSETIHIAEHLVH